MNWLCKIGLHLDFTVSKSELGMCASHHTWKQCNYCKRVWHYYFAGGVYEAETWEEVNKVGDIPFEIGDLRDEKI